MRNSVSEMRAAAGLTQSELARRLDVSRQTVISIERGRYDPSLPLAFRIARLFGRTIEEVFHVDD
ncbi:helix-turn-helix transcriptional regulator [Cellulomonas cellasea]|uniref:helix-turn-helix transcriptional regulator n=1 Tax=Cellulomonas cellasea TaxID=43670 RepID=UPI0025A37E88|nr:helix-turn-helix transcriptional regulator [Cellulomonas cellasea]MDM8084034.1 helix-turn-helix transcriptional regulator [Cellulomonas cellasea]